MLRAQLASLVVVLPFGLADLSASQWKTSSLLAMIPLGVLGTGFAFVMMISLVGRVGSTRGSVPIYLGAPVAVALGVVVLGEAVHPAAVVGTGLVIAGAWWTSRGEAPRPRRSVGGLSTLLPSEVSPTRLPSCPGGISPNPRRD
ncbi:MAG: EamA family transporter [Acidobacteriota bacterium]